MLILKSTTDIVRLTNGSAGELNVSASLTETDNSVPPVTQDTPDPAHLGAITTATTTTLVAAPATSSKRRNVKTLVITNPHATVNQSIVVERYDGSTAVQIWGGVLLVGEMLVMDETGNWTHLDANGGVYAAALKLDVFLRVTADQAFATAATLADITDLSGTAIKNGKKYGFEICLFTTNNASTTGSQFAVNGPAATTFVAGEFGASTNAVVTGVIDTGTATAINTVIVAQTTGQTAVGLHLIAGYYEPSADGTFAVRATSEITVAAGLTVKKGSWLRLRELDN